MLFRSRRDSRVWESKISRSRTKEWFESRRILSPLCTAITMRSKPSSPDPAQFLPNRNHEIAIPGPDTYHQVEILVQWAHSYAKEKFPVTAGYCTSTTISIQDFVVEKCSLMLSLSSHPTHEFRIVFQRYNHLIIFHTRNLRTISQWKNEKRQSRIGL